MIPKIIHYCWFGPAEMNTMAKKCIESWRRHLSDYELKLWNEESFDLNSTTWTRQAYDAKKYAFVTDYVRLYALYNFGGIYMDTDVEVLKSLDGFLDCPAFSGFETATAIPTGIMGSEKNGVWAGKMLEYYKDRPFLDEKGKYEAVTNVTVITDLMKEYGFVPNNQFQVCGGIFHLYPYDYFCPKDQITLQVNLTENTHCIHHFNGSWVEPVLRWRKKIRSLLPTNIYLAFRKVLKNNNPHL